MFTVSGGISCQSVVRWTLCQYCDASVTVVKKVKLVPYLKWGLSPELISPVSKQSSHTWLSHKPYLLFIRPTDTFPAAEHHRRLASTKWYCLMTEARVVNNLFRVVTWQCSGWELNLWPLDCEVILLTIAPPAHNCHRFHIYSQQAFAVLYIKYSFISFVGTSVVKCLWTCPVNWGCCWNIVMWWDCDEAVLGLTWCCHCWS